MMSHRLFSSISCLFVVSLLLATSGCHEEYSVWSQGNQSQFERTVNRKIVLEGSDTLDILSHAGAITVTGSDASDCDVVAKIVARAPTEEEAQELAEQVEIVSQPTNSTLRVRSQEPNLKDNRSISVSYTITIPKQMHVKCDSSFGSLRVSTIEGRVDGKSGNGSIEVRDIRGSVDLNSAFGSIECREVAGPSIALHSGNGGITAVGLQGSLTAETAFGSIVCENTSDGDLKLKSGNGGVSVANASFGVCEARSSFGKITANGLKGDAVTLASGNGGVEADDVQAQTLDLSSSYGSVHASGVTASRLSATSGNGGVHIACSPSGPGDLNAKVRSSFGSVEFVAPSAFAGEVNLSTTFGEIRTDLPMTVSGEISKKRISGKVGDGAGKIVLESGNGSVELK